MSILKKVKTFLGIHGVTIELEIPLEIPKDSKRLEGNVAVHSKSDQQIISITVSFIEKHITGKGKEKKTRKFELGTCVIAGPINLQAGIVRTFPIRLDFAIMKTKNEALTAQGGVFHVLGKIGSFVQKEHCDYYVTARAEVCDAAFDSTDMKIVSFV